MSGRMSYSELLGVIADLERQRAEREAQRKIIVLRHVENGTITTTRGILDADGFFHEIPEE